jgi:hypothetical protein
MIHIECPIVKIVVRLPRCVRPHLYALITVTTGSTFRAYNTYIAAACASQKVLRKDFVRLTHFALQ